MLLFDFINPYVTYFFVLGLFIVCLISLFQYREQISKHKNKIIFIAMILLLWTQFARYAGALFEEDTTWSFWMFNFKVKAWSWGSHLPFYICRLSAVVLLYYTITKDKRVESFLFYWGATGLAGVLYPNSSDIYNIFTLTETFYIDHFLLAITPFFLVLYQGYRPSKKDVYVITALMFVILSAFIPLNLLITRWIDIDGYQVDYFYVKNQSIVGELSTTFLGDKLPSMVFVMIHTFAAYLFFSLYYRLFRVLNIEVKGDKNENRVIY